MRGFPPLLLAAVSCAGDVATESRGTAGRFGATFVDAAAEAGVRLRNACGAPGRGKRHITETTGAGAAFADFDGDGDLDLFVANGLGEDARDAPPPRGALYRNDGGWRFTDVTAEAGLAEPGWGGGALAFDYDGDGDADLYLTRLGENRLYRNRGDATFEDATAPSRGGLRGCSTGAAAADADLDGDLDLFVAGYVEWNEEARATSEAGCLFRGLRVICGPRGLPAAEDAYFENRGDGTFVERAREAGLSLDPPRYGLGVLFADLDLDGDPDLYVANDSNPNALFRNLGAGAFREEALFAGAAFGENGEAQAGMGLALGDAEGDGGLDLFVTNFSHDANALYRYAGRGRYEDATFRSGLGPPSFDRLGWGCGFHDFDGDGDLDLFVGNGHVYPNVEDAPLATTYAQANQIFENLGAGAFRDASASAGPAFDARGLARGVAFGDPDDDGDTDVFVVNLDGPPAFLRNEGGNRGGFVRLALAGVRSPRSGTGARVEAEFAGRRAVRLALAGSSYASTDDPRILVGLGGAASVRIRVRWPSGIVDDLGSLPAGSALRVIEGSSPAR